MAFSSDTQGLKKKRTVLLYENNPHTIREAEQPDLYLMLDTMCANSIVHTLPSLSISFSSRTDKCVVNSQPHNKKVLSSNLLADWDPSVQ